MKTTIRHSEIKDIEGIKEIYAQPSCYAGTLQLPYPSLDKWHKNLENLPENFHSLVAEVDGAIVGQIGLQVFTRPRRKHAANIGMGVSEAYRGKGIGSKLLQAALDLADNWLAVTRVELEVYTDNLNAIKLYKKHGFIKEGTAQKYAFRNGEYVDVYLMARV